MPCLYAILTIEIASIINWTNGIAFLGFLPLVFTLRDKWKTYRNSEYFTFKEIFDDEFIRSFIIGFVILLFAIFQYRGDAKEKIQKDSQIISLKSQLGDNRFNDSCQIDSLNNIVTAKTDTIEARTDTRDGKHWFKWVEQVAVSAMKLEQAITVYEAERLSRVFKMANRNEIQARKKLYEAFGTTIEVIKFQSYIYDQIRERLSK